MRRHWNNEALAAHWSLGTDEWTLFYKKNDTSRLGLAVLLKFFQLEGRFPRSAREIAIAGLDYLAGQLNISPALLFEYDFEGRSAKRHRQLIRDFLGVRAATPADAQRLRQWLTVSVLPGNPSSLQLREAATEWCRRHRIEPSRHARIDRLVRGVLRKQEREWQYRTHDRLSDNTQAAMDRLLLSSSAVPVVDDAEDETDTGYEASEFAFLKTGPGAASVKSVTREIEKLRCIDRLAVPKDLFVDSPRRLIQVYRNRAAAEPPREMRRHRTPVRYTLLVAFVWKRRREIIDGLVELLIQIIHKIGARAERRVIQTILQDIRKVRGKNTLLYKLAAATLANPDGIVRDVLFPVVRERTLIDIVKEYEASGPAHRRQVQTVMRASYSHHYRRILPLILDNLEFRSNNRRHRPVIVALDWLRGTRDTALRFHPLDNKMPVENIVPRDWEDLVFHEDRHGKPQVNRIAYELCVLTALRQRLRCREIWVVGAERFGNPDDDIPANFDRKRKAYYGLLEQPRNPDVFMRGLQKAMKTALATLAKELPDNAKVRILDRPRNRIRLSPLTRQPEPHQLATLKLEISRRWPMTSLLDVLKEAELRVGFTDEFRSVGTREVIDRQELQPRLLLSLYGLGTNTGLKAVAAGQVDISYGDLLRVRRMYIHRDALRAAIARVVNAVLAVRLAEIWGEGTSACASDSKKVGAWDQNLMTEWHVRYGGRGVMIYWHVERRSMCIYSQLKRCSSSEVAAMIEGVLRHCTDMEIEKNYVDSHGQSEVGFAFCHLLGFDLMPRLKGIATQKLYRPVVGQRSAYPQLQPILTRPIRWDLIARQYDEMIKFATALRMGTTDAEGILRRFTRSSPAHPTYRAFAELGKAVKTMFLCRYLSSTALRREVHEGLNVIERWNGTQDFIYFGKRGEIATNRLEDQEISVLALHLLQVCLVYINTLMIEQVLAEPTWLQRMAPEDFRALTPLIYNHITPYGVFRLDMGERLSLDDRGSPYRDVSSGQPSSEPALDGTW